MWASGMQSEGNRITGMQVAELHIVRVQGAGCRAAGLQD